MSATRKPKIIKDDSIIGKKTTITKESRSKEEGDKPTLHDSMFNLVAGSHFETGVAMTILDQPGISGRILQEYTNAVANIIEKVYDTAFGNVTILMNSKKISVKEYFDQKILGVLNPSSDQIGRSLEASDQKEWNFGKGKHWVVKQLRFNCFEPHHTFKNMLTKIRTINAFGTIIRELNISNKEIVREITLHNKSDNLISRIRHSSFDTPATRARIEKTPLIGKEKKPINLYISPLLNALNRDKKEEEKLHFTIDGTSKGLFEKIWHPAHLNNIIDQYEAMLKRSESKIVQDESLIREARQAVAQYQLDEEKMGGPQALPRLGQDIMHSERPGLLGESSIALMPLEFKKSGLKTELKKHYFKHGSGMNRWQLQGSYAKESWNHDFPAAGAHSGGTSDILLAFSCLCEREVFGTEMIKPLGLLVSAFMNFGGYHSFIETFRIILAAADPSREKKFTLEISENNTEFYTLIYNIAQEYRMGNLEKMRNYLNSFKKSLVTYKKSVTAPSSLFRPLLDSSSGDSKSSSPPSAEKKYAEFSSPFIRCKL